MKSSFSLLFLFIVLALFSQSNAQNLTTSVQGVLRDAVGHSVEDGTYSLVFKLYSVDNGGTALWNETQDNVVVTHGVFSVELGSVTSLPNIDAGQVYYIGISVEGGAELQPRLKLHKAFSANVTAAMAGFTNKVPSTGTASLDVVKFPDNTSLSTADPNKLGIPLGGIILWNGTEASVPSNWKICDGANGTPDLRDRFVIGVGAGSSLARGAVGGSTTHTLTVGQLPAHSHTGSTNADGSHSHSFDDYTWSSQSYGNAGRTGTGASEDNDNNYGNGVNHSTWNAGSHSHSFTTNNTGSGQSINHLPPYFGLYYIMKISN